MPIEFAEWKSDLPDDFDFAKYPTLIDRYYKKRYYRPDTTAYDDEWATTCILTHSNGCCLVCISPDHPLIADPDLSIVEIDFQTGPKTNRLDSKPVGKSKKFAQKVKSENDLLCKIVGSNGKTYRLASGCRGRLLEINDRIVNNYKLIKSDPTSLGFIAIVMPPRNGKVYSFTPGHRFEDSFTGVSQENVVEASKD